MNFELFVARIIDGLNNGVIYAFMALALVVIYKGSSHLSIAQGQLAVLSAYVAWALTREGFPVAVAVVLAILVGFLIAASVEHALIRPLGVRAHDKALLVGIGLLLGLEALVGLLWGTDPLAFPSLVPSGPTSYVSVLGTHVQYQNFLIAGLLLVVLVVLWVFFNRTKLGLAMRTAADNPDSAELLGMRVNALTAFGWGIAGAIGALAAVLIAPSTTLTPVMLFNVLLYGIAAALLGGFDSPGGAVLAGLILGVVENLAASYLSFIGQDLKQAVGLIAIVVVLVVRPSGLFGSRRVERV
jgi:branched-chain amino acid transport system permease protein